MIMRIIIKQELSKDNKVTRWQPSFSSNYQLHNMIRQRLKALSTDNDNEMPGYDNSYPDI